MIVVLATFRVQTSNSLAFVLSKSVGRNMAILGLYYTIGYAKLRALKKNCLVGRTPYERYA